MARSIAAADGWGVDAPTGHVRSGPPREFRVAVSGAQLPGRCVLRLRERPPGTTGRAELEARVGAASEHVVGVRAEVSVRSVRGREMEAVLLDHPEHGDLEGLLARRGGIRSGEAATVLLGVAAGLAALHASGWAGPELTASGVVFLGDGCPALDGLDAVESWTAEAAVTDAEGFHALARTVCLKVTDGSGMRLLGAVDAGLRRGSWSALAESVLQVVAPEPVGLEPGAREPVVPGPRGVDERGRSPSNRAVPGRIVTSQGSASGRARRGMPGRPGGRGVALVSRVMDLLDGRPGRALGERLRATLRRRPALIGVAIVPVAAAVVLVALLPAPGASQTTPVEAARAVVPEATVGSDAAGRTGAPGLPGPSAAKPASPSSPRASTRSPSAVTPAAGGGEAPVEVGGSAGGAASEDPVDAARAVLHARHSCFAKRPARPDCLSGVLDEGSPFAAEEAAALGAEGAAGKRDYTGAQLSLVERWGGAALVGAAPDSARTPESEPASLLLVRSEAGWRLRAVYP